MKNQSKKPKVAIYYSTSFGRNDGAPLYYFNVLSRQLGLEVVHLDPSKPMDRYNDFDLHFWVDWGEDGLPVPKDMMPIKDGGKTIYVASDTHLGMDYRLNKAKQFDHVFVNQLAAKVEAEARGMKNVDWLPHAFEPQAYPRYPIFKKYDVCFIGHLQDTENFNGLNRLDFLEEVFRNQPNFYFGTRHPAYPEKNMFEDAAKTMAQSKICINISMKDDVNMRVFETLGTGSMLLTNWLPTLQDLFEDNKHLVTYRDTHDALSKINYYLENEQEREKIAFAGYQEAIKKHTYKNRVLHILNTLGYNIQ